MKKAYAMVEKNGEVVCYEGKLHELMQLDEVQDLRDNLECPLVFVNPFRTIRERGSGFRARGDEPILVLETFTTKTFSREYFLKKLKRDTVGDLIELEGEIIPSVSDEDFAMQVWQIQNEEIAGGNASQIVLSRKFRGQIKNMSSIMYFVLYKRLLELTGQYMTFLFNVNDEYAFIGATPECHLRIQNKKVVMNPIAGTLRKTTSSNFKEELENFLKDKKEINELFQVLDEELKMMAKICPKDGEIIGPKLRETGSVIHTEYELVGERDNNNTSAIVALRETLHAPTLVGSPIESASRIIDRYEQDSRGYYGGQYGVYKPNGDLDSAIFIRTAKLSINGEFIVQAGAGIVKDSIPFKEAQETTAKANGFLNSLKDVSNRKNYLTNVGSDWVENLLRKRNIHLSFFHLKKQTKCKEVAGLKKVRITVVNNEDNFALMLAHMVRHLGCQVEVMDTFQFDPNKCDSDIIVLGPGPGDINDTNNPRIQKLRLITKQLIDNQIPILGVCLGHQALAVEMGMKVSRLEPMQGVQAKIRVLGRPEYLGFYNSFFVEAENLPSGFEVSSDIKDRIMAMRSKKIISLQFHPESVMS
ncbi:MAG: chorismate-binding protein, partial [Patescibacteria group bacterium]